MLGITYWTRTRAETRQPLGQPVVARPQQDVGVQRDVGGLGPLDAGRSAVLDAGPARRTPPVRLRVLGAQGSIPNGASDLPRSGRFVLTHGALTVNGRYQRQGGRQVKLRLTVSPWAVLYPPGSGSLRSPPERTFDVVVGRPLVLGVAAPGTPRFDLTFSLGAR